MNIGLIILFLAAAYFYLTKYWLSLRNRLERADVVVVPSGDMYLRCDQAIEVFKNGYVDKILFSGKTGSKNALELKKRAIRAGIPCKHIIIEKRSTNSLENAQYTKEILLRNNFKTIILVSSPYSQRRQYMSFKKILGGSNIKIINYPVKKYNWFVKTPGKDKYRWQYLVEEPYYIIKYWLKGDIRT